jgi:hypothetical protein
VELVAIELNCHSCGQALAFPGLIGRGDECDKCGNDVHVCLNCRFYDTSSYNECREPSAEVVREKDRSNFCDFFEAGSGSGGGLDKNSLKSAAEALFKK